MKKVNVLIGLVFVAAFLASGCLGGSSEPIIDDRYGPTPEGAVEIIEYSDFQCPFCARVAPTVGQIKAEYGDNVNIIFKHYPLPSHNFAEKAAIASECARGQGKFWEYHDLMFENQADLSISSMKTWAGQLDLDTEQFDDCLDSNKYRKIVNADLAEGGARGVTGTPTFFINDRKIVGAQPFSAFQELIDKEL